MAVDMLRSCHYSRVRLIEGDPTVHLIRWYFCQPGAKILPQATVYGSQVWEVVELPEGGNGPVDRNFVWNNGRNRGFAGLSFQGNPEWFITGIPPTALAAPVVSMLCGTIHMSSIGGVSINGEAHYMDSGLMASGGAILDSTFFGGGFMIASGGVEVNGTSIFGISVIIEPEP